MCLRVFPCPASPFPRSPSPLHADLWLRGSAPCCALRPWAGRTRPGPRGEFPLLCGAPTKEPAGGRAGDGPLSCGTPDTRPSLLQRQRPAVFPGACWRDCCGLQPATGTRAQLGLAAKLGRVCSPESQSFPGPDGGRAPRPSPAPGPRESLQPRHPTSQPEQPLRWGAWGSAPPNALWAGCPRSPGLTPVCACPVSLPSALRTVL